MVPGLAGAENAWNKRDVGVSNTDEVMQKRDLTLALGLAALALGMSGAGSVCHGASPVLWTGPNITISEPNGGQDTLTPDVILKWNGTQGIYNAGTENGSQIETGYTHFSSPLGTAWAFGSLSNYASLNYTTWEGLEKPLNQVGREEVVHLIQDNIYLSIKLTSWGGKGGGLNYIRSTPPAVVAPGPLTVKITSPTNGTVFLAPAQVMINATAAETGGSVSNVVFFLNRGVVGGSSAPPYGAKITGLKAGAYTISAVATDGNGATATNSVQITVTAPPVVTIVLSSPVVAGGQLQFSVSGLVAGKTNLVQASSDLSSSTNWINVSTNVPTTTNMTVSGLDATAAGARFFRVTQQP